MHFHRPGNASTTGHLQNHSGARLPDDLATMSILDLPVDILLLIFPHLDATSFLHLSSTCKALHNADFLNDAAFWSTLVRTTFRVPNQPTAQHDGKRWQKLYKRLLTQSRIYTWGDNDKACLGHSYDAPAAMARLGPPRARRVNALRRRHISWPAEMNSTENLGVISDVQCGGWSTTMLTAKGTLYTVGVLDGLQFDQRRAPFMQTPARQPTALKYPPGFVQLHERNDSSTAIQQFSTGRAHVLGLADSGRIWSWQNIELAALHVMFLNHDTKEDGTAAGRGTVHKVVAGWNKSAALIEGIGIVLWDPLQRGHDDTAIEDAVLVLESAVVPNTGYRRSKGKKSTHTADTNPDIAETVDQVGNFILLEHVLLFSTDIGKVFAAQIFWDDHEQRVGEPVEITISDSETEIFATDVQGSFRSFAIFTRDGNVLTSNQDRLMDLLRDNQAPDNLFTRIPALQHRGVISVAFGDYHFHALHSSGHITSYGNEPQACGALGLGGHGDPEGRLRGIRYQGMGGDGRLVPHAYTEGRRVWFEEEKRDWIKFLTAGGVDAEEASQRMRMALGTPDVRCQGEVSEWIEQQGRDWESKFGLKGEEDDELGAYFALSVTAAGWHSGALVLVNEELAAKVQAACEVRESSSTTAEGEEDAQDPPAEDANSSLLSYAVSTALDYGRWFLGLAPYNVPAPTPHNAPHNNTAGAASNRVGEQIHVPRNYGDSPREGYKYVWAKHSFPRLVLSNGEEMPGEVGFDEWRFARPEFDLDAGV
ncbi:hypothetical protein LTR91_006848 [Friedmanniomyces endolithicus]|uniref:F-box domain-containing protein n=1 Tax=Friedmanniomyces endolithicus TaxID=329885 RepID=A0AAN6QW04_9PEZI|nr:hypothetical protein LTR38_016375 [Friedmanniomyces endolithicus]KAK0889224.1 hypothetical protein LTR02_015619 [Friedmanniomyces endolithicus]KAK0996636.1 hypothetical protein LTR91_006848 [Friedmanniomyces endolithicus]KAK1026713.1 hypothetical protein LTS16_022089 [Friedmanniomyces endolithicus]